MKWGSFVAVVICAQSSIALAEEPSPPPSATIAAAEQLFNEGRSMFDKGDFAAACPRFEASYKLDAALGTLLNMATCYEKLGQLASAWGRYREVLAVATKVGDLARIKIARDRADAIEPKLPRLTIRVGAAIPGLAVTRDDIPVDPAVIGVGVYVDPGDHTVTASAVGRKPFTQTVTLAEMGTRIVVVPDLAVDPSYKGPVPVAGPTTIRVEQEALDPGRTRRILGLALGGAGIAATVGGVSVGLFASSTYDKAFDDGLCDRATLQCTADGQERTNTARRQALISNLVTVGGVAMVAGGVLLYMTAPSAGRLSITPGAEGGANVTLGGQW